MKRLILIISLTSFAISLLAQITQGEWLNHSFYFKDYKEIKYLDKQLISHSDSFPAILKSYNYSRNPIMPLLIDQNENLKSYTNCNVRNIHVSRNPEQVLITNDDQFAFIRCFLSNSIDLIKIPEGKLVKSFSIPSPQYISMSNDGASLLAASLIDSMVPPDPPDDDCSIFQINLSGLSLLTSIDIALQEINHTDTIKIPYIRKILISSNDSTIYLVGENVVEYNLSTFTIKRQWQISNQIFQSEIDNKNQKIFLTAIDSTAVCYLMV